MAALNAASISKFVVSSKYCVLGPCARGQRHGFLSRSSRRSDIGQHFGLGHAMASLAELAIAPPRALLGARGHEQFHVGIRADDRADVAAVDDGAGLAPAKAR